MGISAIGKLGPPEVHPHSAQVLVHYGRRVIEEQGLLWKLILNRIVLRSRSQTKALDLPKT